MAATSSSALKMTVLSDREMVMIRVFDAPRELVFEAHTNPSLIPKWWGPRNLTTVVDKMDVRPGGLWRYVQRDAEGNEYAFHGEYREVVPPERLTWTFEFEGMPGQVAVETASFEDEDGKTRITVQSRFDSREALEGMLQSGMEEGAIETWDRLAELVESSASKRDKVRDATRDMVITRVLEAPPALVFKAWTRPEHFMRWWGPNGFTTPVCNIDLRPGGLLHYCMRSPEGQDIWCKGVFREIIEPSRIVFTDSFADEQGKTVPGLRYGISEEWPLETLVTVTFEEHAGMTRMTLRHAGIPVGTEGDMAEAGWKESLERLAAHVKTARREEDQNAGQN
jgi:uncharacterized protein YndB with AHSA1/START domain